MNAFTQKPDLSKFFKDARHSQQAQRNGVVRAIQQGGQPVLGMGERDKTKVQTHQKGSK